MRSSLGLALALFLISPFAVAAQTAEFLGAYTWSSSKSEFGGFSALAMSERGQEILAVSDRGFLAYGTVERDGSDALIQSIELERMHPLRNAQGVELKPKDRDSEGLAIAPDGSLFLSFEAIHGVGQFDASGRMLSDGLLRHPDFPGMQLNSSLEPLALDEDGRLCTAPERSGRLQRPFPVYCLDERGWSQPFVIPRSNDFLLAGMDFGPDGRLYVLERALRGIFFATRVRSFRVDPTSLADERLLIETRSGRHDNLEGISVWQTDAGDIRISMISDDNYNLFQRTEIVEYRVR